MTVLYATDAERALLGALLMRGERVRDITLTAADFDPGHGHDRVFDALRAVVDRDGTADELTVLQELRKRGQAEQVGDRSSNHAGGLYLHSLVEACPLAANYRAYAEQVVEAGRRRAINRIGMQLQQDSLQADDLDDLLSAAAQRLVQLQLTVDEVDSTRRVTGLSGMAEFVDVADDPFDWIVPGLLERQDRVILVAAEGVGKSMLSRQIAVTVASGVHPFLPLVRIPPQRTLLIDLENPPGLVRRKTRGLVERARDLGVWSDGNAFCWLKPSGLNLRRVGDQQLLDQVLTETRPALVCLGPLYKAFVSTGDSYEQTASEVSSFLDRMRERHRVAWWIEHHMPKEQGGARSLVPFGASLWQRWPEFGMAMRRDHEDSRSVWLETFRGHRDERRWPIGFTWGQEWPWMPLWDQDTQKLLRAEGAL